MARSPSAAPLRAGYRPECTDRAECLAGHAVVSSNAPARPRRHTGTGSRRERLKLAALIVQNTDGAGEPEFPGTSSDHDRVVRTANAPAQHGVDSDSELSVSSEPFELPVKHAQALFRNVVGCNVVDADLQIIESRAVQRADTVRSPEQAVGDQSRDRAAVANSTDDSIPDQDAAWARRRLM